MAAKPTQLVFTNELESKILSFSRKLKPSSTVFLVDERFLVRFRRLVKNERIPRAHVVAVRGEEKSKKLKEFERIVGQLIRLGADRKTLLVCVGGGVVGDLGGFAASVYMRGIRWISVPTTLLAMVDSGYGGKTAINHKFLKNVIGTFHPPVAVLIDANFLRSLSVRDLTSGAGEVLKYGLLYRPSLFWNLSPEDVRKWKKKPQKSLPYLRAALKFKSDVTAKDLYDRKGVRQVLNLGHTFGHALEAITNHKFYRHGEAVIMGLEFSTRVARIQGFLSAQKQEKIVKHLREFSVPHLKKKIPYHDLWSYMRKDKKSEAGDVKMVLLRDFKKPLAAQRVSSSDAMLAVIEMTKSRGLKVT